MKRILLAAGFVALCAGAIAAVQRWRNGDGEKAVVPAVESLPVPRGPGSGVGARALGKVEAASEEIGVSSDITGRIAEILVDEGDVVEKGAPLVRLEPFVYASRVEAAKAALAQAVARKKLLEAGARSEDIDVARALLEATKASERLAVLAWERTRQLIESGITAQHAADEVREEAGRARSRVKAAEERLKIALHETRKEELDAAEAEVAQRKHELAVAEAELEKTVLKAPIAGTIVRKNLRMGEAVSSFQVSPVVTIADMLDLRVRAEVDEVDMAHVRVGQPVELEVLALAGRVLHGKVLRLGKTMGRKKVESNDPNERVDSRVLEVLIDIDEPDELPLGFRVTVSFLE